MASSDPVVRLSGMLRLLTSGFAVLDPLYSVMRRDLAVMPRRNILREDEVFAIRLALAGPWGHVPAPLARRHRSEVSSATSSQLLDVPGWHRHAMDALLCRELLDWIARSPLDPSSAGEHGPRCSGCTRAASATRCCAESPSSNGWRAGRAACRPRVPRDPRGDASTDQPGGRGPLPRSGHPAAAPARGADARPTVPAWGRHSAPATSPSSPSAIAVTSSWRASCAAVSTASSPTEVEHVLVVPGPTSGSSPRWRAAVAAS